MLKFTKKLYNKQRKPARAAIIIKTSQSSKTLLGLRMDLSSVHVRRPHQSRDHWEMRGGEGEEGDTQREREREREREERERVKANRGFSLSCAVRLSYATTTRRRRRRSVVWRKRARAGALCVRQVRAWQCARTHGLSSWGLASNPRGGATVLIKVSGMEVGGGV